MKKQQKFYIGKRVNPQLEKPYYRAYGQLSKTAAKEKEGSIYGSMTLKSYDTQAEYDAAIAQLKQEGFSVR